MNECSVTTVIGLQHAVRLRLLQKKYHYLILGLQIIQKRFNCMKCMSVVISFWCEIGRTDEAPLTLLFPTYLLIWPLKESVEMADLSSELHLYTNNLACKGIPLYTHTLTNVFQSEAWVWTQWFTVVKLLLGGAIGSIVFEGETKHWEWSNTVDLSVFTQIVKVKTHLVRIYPAVKCLYSNELYVQ